MGITMLYGFLFGVGRMIYGDWIVGCGLVGVAGILAYLVIKREAAHQH